MADLRSVIEGLIRRPAFWRADPPLPTVLVTGDQAVAAIQQLAEPFEDCVPYAFVKDGEHASVLDLVKSLAGEHGQLGKPVGGSLLPPPRFPLAQFVLWAREQRDLPPPETGTWPPEPQSHTGYREFRKRLKSWRRRSSGGDRGVRTSADFLTRAATTWVPVGTLAVWWVGGASDLVGVIPWLFGALVALAGTAAQGMLSIRGSLFMRWLRTTPALRRKRFERLPQYALRLANSPAEEVEELLVHAMMQDLRDAYKKWIIPWPSWGRGLYALLAVQVDDPQGTNARFLGLIEEITKKSGLLAPMVVLAAVPEIPSRPQARPENLDNLEEVVRRWRGAARLGVPDLRVAVEATAPPEGTPAYRPPQPHRARARTYWAVMALLLVVPLALVGWIQRDRDEHCGGLLWAERIAGECVGIVNATRATPDGLFEGEVKDLIKKIDANNVYATSSGRYVSMVLFGEFSIRKTAPDDTRLPAAVSELAAVEEYQRTVTSTPRLRILIANAGDNFVHGQRTARLITEMAAQDPHVMAVVGLPRSVSGVSQAIKELHLAKIPMVASTATADRLGYVKKDDTSPDPDNPSPYFFHVAPTNYRQATLGARFVQKTLFPKLDEPAAAIVEDRSPSDEYTNNLADDFEQALKAERVRVKERIPYTVDEGGISAAAQKACRLRPDVLVYAGRASEFRAFLTAIEGQACGKVKVVAGDDVVKVVSDHGDEIADMKRVEVYHLTLASRLLWERDSATAFVSKLLNGAHATRSDDNLILTYDAVNVVYRAANDAYRAASTAGGLEDQRLPSRGDILYRLARTSGEAAWAGSSGVVDFNATERHTPTDKAIAIMRVARAPWGHARPVVRCGRLDTNEPPAAKDALCANLPDTPPTAAGQGFR
ncbi:ABC transporter substrate-binding protein [Nonomuraea sp. NPDC049709]|uniref:ABC transporter substrate-binding protein n=1 Tax=Nonomuraea sp. NPDC049709 TaxID=3154736 RepID=UPI00341A0EC7